MAIPKSSQVATTSALRIVRTERRFWTAATDAASAARRTCSAVTLEMPIRAIFPSWRRSLKGAYALFNRDIIEVHSVDVVQRQAVEP